MRPYKLAFLLVHTRVDTSKGLQMKPTTTDLALTFKQ